MGEGETAGAAAWFLTAADRGNPAARIDRGASAAGWSAGNRVEVLVDGATYFSRLYQVLCSLRAGVRCCSTSGCAAGAATTRSCS